MARRRQHGEGSLYHRSGDGRWVATVNEGYKNNVRQRRVFTGATPEEAMKKRTVYLDKKRDGFRMPKGRQPYVDEWVRHWLVNVAKPKVSATTWHNSYRQKAEELICPFFERVQLTELDEELIEEWHRQLEAKVSKRTGRHLSASTIGQAHRILSSALKVAVTRGRMPRNPCSNVTPPQVVRAEAEPPTAGEAARILERCRTWPNGARWVLAIATGLRQGEALALEWRDVRLADPASVTVRQSAARADGKLIVKAPKSAKGRRTVPLAAVAVEALKRHRADGPAAISGLVFVSDRGRPVHPRVDYADWVALLADLGLPHYRVHDLRHGFATLLLEQGEDPRVVQDLMGWSSAAMLVLYQHVRPVLHERALGRIDRALGDG